MQRRTLGGLSAWYFVQVLVARGISRFFSLVFVFSSSINLFNKSQNTVKIKFKHNHSTNAAVHHHSMDNLHTDPGYSTYYRQIYPTHTPAPQDTSPPVDSDNSDSPVVGR